MSIEVSIPSIELFRLARTSLVTQSREISAKLSQLDNEIAKLEALNPGDIQTSTLGDMLQPILVSSKPLVLQREAPRRIPSIVRLWKTDKNFRAYHHEMLCASWAFRKTGMREEWVQEFKRKVQAAIRTKRDWRDTVPEQVRAVAKAPQY